jgi:hypothetical protein
MARHGCEVIMLTSKIQTDINTVASNARVQACIISALCSGQEENELWLALEDDVDAFPTQIAKLLFGAQYFEDEFAPLKGLYDCGYSAIEVMQELLKRVEKQVRHKLLGHKDDYCVSCEMIMPCDCPHTE